jgi:hypothetical protein
VEDATMAKRKKPSPPQPAIDPKYVMDSIAREDFYRGKQVVHEEWFVYDRDLVTWVRLRAFDDGTTDVWEPEGMLTGIAEERFARHYLGEGHFVAPRELATWEGQVPQCEPPMEQASAAAQHFRYYGMY